MLKFIFLLGSAYSQTLTLSGPLTVKIGSTVTVSLRLSGSSVNRPVSLQWQSTLPNAGYTLSSPTSAVVGKTITCQAYKCLLSGMNRTAIANGVVATFHLNLPRQMATGYATVSLSNLVGASSTGGTINVTRGTMYTFYVKR